MRVTASSNYIWRCCVSASTGARCARGGRCDLVCRDRTVHRDDWLFEWTGPYHLRGRRKGAGGREVRAASPMLITSISTRARSSTTRDTSSSITIFTPSRIPPSMFAAMCCHLHNRRLLPLTKAELSGATLSRVRSTSPITRASPLASARPRHFHREAEQIDQLLARVADDMRAEKRWPHRGCGLGEEA
jgi:hypothetical protein